MYQPVVTTGQEGILHPEGLFRVHDEGGLSIQEMKEYIALCLVGAGSIPERKVILDRKRDRLLERMAELQASIDYIDWKQGFYDDVLSGRRKYVSNLLPADQQA